MDHDVMHRDVQGLKAFRTRVESAITFIEGLQAGGGKVPAAEHAQLSDDDRNKVIDAVVAKLGQRLDEISTRLDQVEAPHTDLSGVEGRLSALETAGEKPQGTAQDPELTGRIENMLTWFDANQEGLELLLSLDGEPDAEVASGDTGSATGAAGSQTGTVTGGPVEGLPGTSQDPSAAASAVVDQPTAKPE